MIHKPYYLCFDPPRDFGCNSVNFGGSVDDSASSMVSPKGVFVPEATAAAEPGRAKMDVLDTMRAKWPGS